MTSSHDRNDAQDAHEDVWAQAVAEDAAEQERRAREERAEREERKERGEHAERTERAERAERGERAERERSSSGSSDPFERFLGGQQPFGPELGPLVDEVRKLAETVGERLQKVQESVVTGPEGIEQLTAPLKERHPEVYRHLAAAGGELLAAYRAAVSGHERRWTGPGGKEGDGGASSGEHIDLD